jgi:type I restriction enzyme, S subunit
MVGEWRTATVQQLVDEGVLERPIDGNHGEIHPKTSDFVEHGIPFVMASDLVDGRVDTTHCAFISEEHARSLRKGFALPGDVLISHKATMGRTAIVDRLDVPYLMLTPQVTYYRVKDPSRLVGRYLKLYFDSPDFQALFETWGQKGSTRAYLGITAQLDLPIALPPPDEQRAIAHILGTLDDKIELNRQMNETLHAMARALFKSWFVDFDPVRAKAEGRNRGHRTPLADLFPPRLVQSELGEIPEGWRPRTVEDVCSTVTRGVTPKYENGSGRYIINQRVNRGAHLNFAELKELTSTLDVPADCYAKRWDVLINCLGEGTLGRAHLFKGKSDTYAVDQHMSICRGTTAAAGAYVYQVLASPAGQDKIESLKTGSTGMTMFNISKLRSFDFLWPGDVLVEAYFRIAQPALARIASNEEQSRTLAALRDTLLPKLISGELRLSGVQ